MVISNLTQKLPLVAIGTLSLGLGSVFINFQPAQAASITYQGTLLDGVPEIDSVSSSGFFRDQFTGRFFNFFGNQGDVVTIEAIRLEQDLDPALWIFEGVFDDTDEFAGGFSLNIDSGDPGFLDFADDEIPTPGPFGDPRSEISLTLPGTGEYTAIVTNYLSGSNDGGDGAFDFQITASNVVQPTPEPASVLSLLAMGTLGVASLKRKKSS